MFKFGIVAMLLAVAFIGCNNNRQQPVTVSKDSGDNHLVAKADSSLPESLNAQIQVIRKNVERINSINKFTSTIQKELEESTEGGEALFFLNDKTIEKIVVHEFGETYQAVTEYFLQNNQLSFVFEKEYRYNRPIYWDSASMKEANDNEVFDFKKSEIIESRYYIQNETIIYRSVSKPESSKEAEPIQKEAERLIANFHRLTSLIK